MTSHVVSVPPDMPVRDIARLLVENGISAAPVVDEVGAPIGVVSEGDLIRRDRAERELRRDWWLTLLAEGEPINPEFLASMNGGQGTARDVMSAPVIAVTENTEAHEIARLLAAYRIKRVPVIRADQIIGIVSRADLLRVIAERRRAGDVVETPKPGLFDWLEEKIERNHRGDHAAVAAPAPSPQLAEKARLTVSDFRHLVWNYREHHSREREKVLSRQTEQRRETIRKLIETHVTDKEWKALIHQAHAAAERGEREFLLMRFPSQLCSDGGRAINAPDRGWPETLRGEAAELYLRWERDLKPGGFHLAARVVEFPDGVPGDIGLFLVWDA